MKHKKLLSLLAGILCLLAGLSSCSNAAVYDYRREKIARYITVDTAALYGLAVEAPARVIVTDEDVTDSLNEMLKEEAVDKSYPDKLPTLDDRVSLLYRVEHEGEPVHGLSNYYGATPLVLPLTAPAADGEEKAAEPAYYATLRAALAEALVGKAAPSSYKLVERKDGKVGAGSLLYCNLSITVEKGGTVTTERKTALRLNLLDDTTNPYYEIFDEIAEMTLGKTADPVRIYDKEETAFITYTVEPLFVVEEEVALRVAVTLPADFDKGGDLATLAGKTVDFILVPVAVVESELPELTDAYVTTLTQGIYKTATEFRRFWKEYLQGIEDDTFKEKLYLALEKELYRLCVPSDYPEAALSAANREIYGLFAQSYDNYVRENGSSRFPTMESYIDEALEVTGAEERESEIREIERETVAGYLAYFAAADALGVRPSDAEVETAVNETLKSLATGEAEVYAAYYGETYFRDQIVYQVTREAVLKKLAETAVVVPPPKKE